MAEAPKEQVKVPVRDGDGWRCPDCNGALKGEPLVEGLRCDKCSIGWSVGFMGELLDAEQTQKSSGLPNRPFVTRGEHGSQVAIGDGQRYIILSTAQALLFASKIQHMAAKGIVWLED